MRKKNINRWPKDQKHPNSNKTPTPKSEIYIIKKIPTSFFNTTLLDKRFSGKDKPEKWKQQDMKQDFKLMLYPVMLSKKPSTLVLAVNCWCWHVWLPHWSWMQNQSSWDNPPRRGNSKNNWMPELRPGSRSQLGLLPHWQGDADHKELHTSSEYWFSNL